MKSNSIYIIILFALIAFASCKKSFEGEATTQLPPDTYLAIDKIYRSGDLRLTTTVEAHWWGLSQTGIITGYEVSTDNMLTWQFTKKQSGTFLLTIPPGKDTADVAIFVRAVDNLGQHDATPASTLYPIKNTPPSIYFDYGNGRRTTSFPAFRYNWIANDTDGLADIQGIEVAFNDTNNIYLFPSNTTAATFAAQISGGVIGNSFNVYQNSKTTASSFTVTGILFDSLNRIYIRSFDRSGSRSKWAKDSIYIKKPKSDILLINDYSSQPNYYRNFYSNKLIALGTAYSKFDAVDYSWNIFPSDNFTTTKNFDYFKKIIWISSDAFSTLKVAGSGTSNFFSNGGKMLMVIDIGGTYIYSESQVSFTPIASFVDPPTSSSQFKINMGDSLLPLQSGWPLLTTSSGILNNNFRPFNVQNSSSTFAYDELYSAKLLVSSPPNPLSVWTGKSTLIARRKNLSNGNTNLIFSAIPLDLLQGNGKVDSVFKKIIIDELNF